jgi:hypothetical protein
MKEVLADIILFQKFILCFTTKLHSKSKTSNAIINQPSLELPLVR